MSRTRKCFGIGWWPIAIGLAVVVCCLSVLSVAQAETIGYWRFEGTEGTGEGQSLDDSGPNDFDLTKAGNPQQYTLPPASGNKGKYFHDPVPQNNLPNKKAYDFDGVGDYLWHSDETKFAVSNFTIEAYVHADSISEFLGGIACQSAGGGGVGTIAWRFGAHSNGKLYLHLSSDGGYGNDYTSTTAGLGTFSTGKDYFVAASVKLDSGGVGDDDGSITFYMQDLTDGGSLKSDTVTHGQSSIYNTDANFNIGLWYSTTQYEWDGLIDEVRWSSTDLSKSDLLAVPEPSTIVLLGTGLLALLLLLRRRRK